MRLLLLAALLVAASPAFAQTTFGVRAGLNLANVSLDDDTDEDFDDIFDRGPRLGLAAGVFAEVAITPMLAFHPELIYSQKGFKLDVDFSGEDFGGIDMDIDGSLSQTIKLDYIEAPLLLAYRMPVGRNGLTLGVEAGPTIGYLLNSGISTTCSGDADFEDFFCDDFDEEEDDDFDDQFNTLEIGGALGVTVGAGPFAVDVRYTRGFTNVLDTDNIDVREDDSVTNGVFTFGARYTLGR